MLLLPARIQRGGQPLKNHKNVHAGFLSNTGPDPLINHKATFVPSQHSMLCQHGHTSEVPFQWCSAGGVVMAHLVVFGSFLPSSTEKNNNNKTSKSSWTPSDKIF